jgi:type II secretory pathway pseudopilin PulG
VSTPDISAGLATEAAARSAADTALSAAIVAERTAREAADTAAAAAGDPTKLPLAGGVLTGSVRGPLAGFTTYISGSTGGPTWTSGAAAPTSTQPVGSLYSCTGGAVGATLYVSRGGGTWAAVAGV